MFKIRPFVKIFLKLLGLINKIQFTINIKFILYILKHVGINILKIPFYLIDISYIINLKLLKVISDQNILRFIFWSVFTSLNYTRIVEPAVSFL